MRASFGDDAVAFSSLEFEVMQAETNSLINDRNALIQRNASLDFSSHRLVIFSPNQVWEQAQNRR